METSLISFDEYQPPCRKLCQIDADRWEEIRQLFDAPEDFVGSPKKQKVGRNSSGKEQSLLDILLDQPNDQLDCFNFTQKHASAPNQEEKIFEGTGSVHTKCNGEYRWKCIDDGLSTIAIYHLLSEDLFRIVALSINGQYVVNSWFGLDQKMGQHLPENFVELPNFQVNEDFGFIFATTDGASLFWHTLQNCQKILEKRTEEESRNLLRTKVIREILETEERYINFLKLLVKVYLSPLRESLQNSSKPILPSKYIKEIFMDIDVILMFNQKLLSKMEAITQSSSQLIGRLFLDMNHYFKMYTQFIQNYNHSIETISKCRKKYTSFERFLFQCQQNPILESKSIEDLLIMPIQRIPRYILLLEELLKNTSSTHQDYYNISIALTKMKGIANLINERKREVEAFFNLLQIYEKFDPKPSNLIAPHRKYILEGEIAHTDISKTGKLKKKKRRYCFLFNDLLLITKATEKKFHPRIQIPLKNVILEGYSFDGQDLANALMIVTPHRRLGLIFRGVEEKEKWVQLITSLRRDLIERKRAKENLFSERMVV